ncbi:MAG: hybrid sensor histidine kinase/response regulator, partial [Brevundimonas sp.]
KSAQALYMAFAQARRGDPGYAIVQIGAREVEVVIGKAGPDRYLMRVAPEAVLPLPVATAPTNGAAAGESRAMAAGAPFGSAVIDGPDL